MTKKTLTQDEIKALLQHSDAAARIPYHADTTLLVDQEQAVILHMLQGMEE